MSKTSVGEVYAKVINDVCEHSRQDFEEGGVELATLDLLRAEWQKKLSSLKVAQLPWDPPPIKEQAITGNSKAIPQALPSNAGNISTPPPPQPVSTAPPIKQENNVSYQAQQPPAPPPQQPQPQQSYHGLSFPQGQPLTARERAAQSLHDNFGHRAGAQIAQLQAPQPRVPLPPNANSSTSYIKQEDSAAPLAGVQDYRPGMPHPTGAPLKTSQTDGASEAHDEWVAEYSRRKALARAHGSEGDHLMKAQFMARQQQLEGGGLLSTLDERKPISRTAHRMVEVSRSDVSAVADSAMPSQSQSLARAQGDAAGDDDEDVEDEDAINSDLDDPDDLAANEEDNENTDQVMLCTYDKVQRVKNKWKCTLKDGVLRVEGNEYVFHKGQGEFEW